MTEELRNLESNFATQPKLFSKWEYENLEIKDETLANYLAITNTKSKVFVPHTAGRYQLKKFRKATMPIIERVIGGLQFHGRNTGKKLKAMRIVRQAMEIIDLQTGENPIQVILDAIVNCGAREDSTRIGKGGNVKRQAVDVSSFRRINQAIYYITKYARDKSMKNSKNIAEILADEFIQAAKANPNCNSIKKKEEIERNAKANR
jgi:small subunit ribosomal protein S5e